jgi:hypothetical protein
MNGRRTEVISGFAPRIHLSIFVQVDVCLMTTSLHKNWLYAKKAEVHGFYLFSVILTLVLNNYLRSLARRSATKVPILW